jgi:PAS domain S-box-containing protein
VRSIASGDVLDVLDDLSDGIVVLGADWRYRYLNERAAAMLGRSRDELLGRHVWTEFLVDPADRFRSAFEHAMRERKEVRIVDHYEPNDVWFECRAIPREDDLVIVFRDVTATQRIEEELREYAERMRLAERIARFGVWTWELDSGRVRWSDELHAIYGLAPGEFAGTVDAFISHLHPDDRERVWADVEHAIATLEPFAFEERIIRPDGEERTLLSQGHATTGADGKVDALIGVCHDVTERTRAERELGATQRRTRAIVDNSPSIVAVKDLEGRFLMANAELGRLLASDPEALVGRECFELFGAELADRLRANDRRAASAGRAVYDEMILLDHGEPRNYLTVTFALPDDDGHPVETCTIATDVTETREVESERLERRRWERRIGSALGEGRMLAYAQPVVDLRTGAMVSCELLVRMVDEDDPHTVLAPAAFLPAAERFGLVQSIDLWMVRKALELAPAIAPEVNLSGVSVGDPALLAEIVGLVKAAPRAARTLVFEITETAAVAHFDAARAFAEEVTELGCGLALDDFGTGFGSFTYLRNLPLRYLKIDTVFVRGLLSSEGDRRVVQSMIGIAQQFGLETIAEGVEDQATQDRLRTMGIDLAQGFHLGRPAPIDRIRSAATSGG